MQVLTIKEQKNLSHLRKIRECLKNYEVYKVILFGSYAYGNQSDDSDVDLIVIENKTGSYKTFRNRINAKSAISKELRNMSDSPVDLLLYTKDEWKQLLKINNSFIKEIKEKGIELQF
jgi:predicted nucleotidyltransferase